MGFQFDFSADFLTLDNLEPLTLRIAGQADQPIPAAQDHPPDWKDADQAGGQVLEGDRYWVWPIVATLAMPPLGSLLIDGDGTKWTILSVTKKQYPQGVWTAHTRNLSVAYGLNNLASVLKASYTKSPGGEALPTWNTILTGIPALPAGRAKGTNPGRQRMAQDDISRFSGRRHFRSGNSRGTGLGRLSVGRFRRAAFQDHAISAGRADRRPSAGCLRTDYRRR